MIKIICDSTAYIPENYVKKHDITILPLTVTLNDEEFVDNDTSRYEEFYEKVENSPTPPQTSQPNLELIQNAFKKIIDNNDEAIVLTISQSLSGTFSTCTMVKNELDHENKISIVDSGSAAQTMFGYVKEAVKMIEKNKSREEIVKHLYDLQENSFISFVPDSLDALKRGGRIGKLNFLIGNILKIKPILTFKKGVLECSKKVVGMKMAIHSLIRSIPAKVKEIFLLKISKSQYFNWFGEELKKTFPNTPITEADVGPVIGTHIGKAIGVGCIVEKEQPV